jgi:hypothetical protein
MLREMGNELLNEDGTPLLNEDGQPLLVQPATSNGDIEQFDFSVNLLQAILWQYTNATNLQGLLSAKDQWYFNNQEQFWTGWFNNVFNLATANDFGLAVWSIILGQPTYISNQASTWPTWGFGSGNQNFGNGGFGSATGNTYQLPTQWARLLLQLRYFQLTRSGTLPEINRMLKYLFAPWCEAWLIDNLDMTQRYYFNFTIPSGMQMIFDNFDVLPRPAGVGSSMWDGSYQRWGFGSNNANFGNAGFGG